MPTGKSISLCLMKTLFFKAIRSICGMEDRLGEVTRWECECQRTNAAQDAENAWATLMRPYLTFCNTEEMFSSNVPQAWSKNAALPLSSLHFAPHVLHENLPAIVILLYFGCLLAVKFVL